MSPHDPLAPSRPRSPWTVLCMAAWIGTLASGLGSLSAQEGALTAQEGSHSAGEDETPKVEANEVREDRGRTYVLYLKSGGVLRTRARLVDQTWEVRDGRNWKALPTGSVERSALEKDLLSQARRLEREARKGDVRRRVAYADWLVRSGLYTEAFRELDAVLSSDPDQAEARQLLLRGELVLGLPDPSVDLDRFFASAGRQGAAGQELAIASLEGLDVATALRQELVNRDSRRRAFAAFALRRLAPGTEIRNLVSRSILDGAREVRTNASLALRDLEDPGVIAPALKALGSKYSAVRSNAVESLGVMNYAAAVPPLVKHLIALQSGTGRRPHAHVYTGRQIAYVQDFDVEVAQNAAIADPVINVVQDAAVLDAAVIGVNQYVLQTERANVRRALSSLTGASPGHTTAAWLRWWEEHGDEWKTDLDPSGRPSSPASPER